MVPAVVDVMANGNFAAYLRVSTDAQGRSGLGLEAQQAAVASYLNGGNWEMGAEFVEVESGKNSDRPELAKALPARSTRQPWQRRRPGAGDAIGRCRQTGGQRHAGDPGDTCRRSQKIPFTEPRS